MDELIAKANIGRFQNALKRARGREERRLLLNLIESERRMLRDSSRHSSSATH